MPATLDTLRRDVARAAATTERNPTEAQAAIGNYRKGKVRLHGLIVAIENPRGSYRHGTANGRKWCVRLPHHYGYILRTESEADADHIDVFLGPDLDSELVFVVDQNKVDTKRFDEHKVMLGFRNVTEAQRAYIESYSGTYGRRIFRAITPMTMPAFKRWARNGDTFAPLSPQVDRYAADNLSTPGDPKRTHNVGETTVIAGKTYRLNENHRWTLADKQDTQPKPAQQGQQPTPVGGKLGDTKQLNTVAKANLGSVHASMQAAIGDFHADPAYAANDGVSHAKSMAADKAQAAYQWMAQNVGQTTGGGMVRNLGGGRLGFASAAGAVAISQLPNGQWQAQYTVHTQPVAASQGQGSPNTQPSSPNAANSEPVAQALPVATPLSLLQAAKFSHDRTKANHAAALANLDYHVYQISHAKATGDKAAIGKAKEDHALAQYHERVARREHGEARKSFAAETKKAGQLTADEKRGAKALNKLPAAEASPPLGTKEPVDTPATPAVPQPTKPKPTDKPPHEMTRDEYAATGNKATSHKQHLKDAFRSGKRVPLSVLKDYPELVAEHSRVSKAATPNVDLSDAEHAQLKQLGFTDVHIAKMREVKAATAPLRTPAKPQADLSQAPASRLVRPPSKAAAAKQAKAVDIAKQATAPVAPTQSKEPTFVDANGVHRFRPSNNWQPVPQGSLVPVGAERSVIDGKPHARWHASTPAEAKMEFAKRHKLT